MGLMKNLGHLLDGGRPYFQVQAYSRVVLTKDLGCLLDGSQPYFQVQAYSRVVLTKDLGCLLAVDPFFKFLRKKPKILLALALMLSMWVFQPKSFLHRHIYPRSTNHRHYHQ